MLFATFIALFEIAESASIIQLADFLSYADDAAYRLDGHHERRFRQTDAAGMPLEEGEQLLLLRHVPSAIAWRETVGVVPPQFVDALLQAAFHQVGTFLGNDGAQRVGNKHAHHVACLLEPLLIGLVFYAAGTYKESISLRPFQLSLDYASDVEGRQ